MRVLPLGRDASHEGNQGFGSSTAQHSRMAQLNAGFRLLFAFPAQFGIELLDALGADTVAEVGLRVVGYI